MFMMRACLCKTLGKQMPAGADALSDKVGHTDLMA